MLPLTQIFPKYFLIQQNLAPSYNSFIRVYYLTNGLSLRGFELTKITFFILGPYRYERQGLQAREDQEETW
jgi:hypothetical protein